MACCDRRRAALREPTGSMVVDIGGGPARCLHLARGSSSRSRSAWAGDELAEAIMNYVKREYKL